MSEFQPMPVTNLPQTPARLSPSEERMWAMLAHLSVLINLVTGAFGPIVALIIYLVYKDRSRYVAYQSLQSLLLQLIGWVGGGLIVGAAWAITGVLSAFLIGICLIPCSCREARWCMRSSRRSKPTRAKISATG